MAVSHFLVHRRFLLAQEDFALYYQILAETEVEAEPAVAVALVAAVVQDFLPVQSDYLLQNPLVAQVARVVHSVLQKEQEASHYLNYHQPAGCHYFDLLADYSDLISLRMAWQFVV
jgi:hypothetical protein